MAREIPEVVRAAAGLAATVVDEARKLPETLPGLPVRFIGMAMQHAMKVQQQYAGLVARGDELFTGIRGEDEPGLATFDDDDGDAAPAEGFRGSAFDRADVVPDEVPDVVGAQTSVETFLEEVPATEEILEELAIDEAIEAAPALRGTAPAAGADASDAPAAELTAPEDTAVELPIAGAADIDDIPTSVDATTADAGVTAEGLSAPAPEDYADRTDDGTETARGDGPIAVATGVPGDTADETPIAAGATVGDGTDPAAGPAPEAPIDGYDTFSIAQLRGRLRGYAFTTVADLVAYEEATLARADYLRMLRNRLEKLEEQAVDSSPLAPRGA